MSSTPLLTGPAFGLPPLAQAHTKRPSLLLRTIVFGWLLAALAAVGIYVFYGQRAHTRPISAPASAAVTSNAELVNRVDAAMGKTATIAANLRRAEQQISLTLPVVDQNALPVEKRRLESAMVITETARRDLEKLRQEVEDQINLLNKEELQ